MERKRKLPARTSARVENANKRRNTTSREERSITPAPPPPPEPVVREPTPPPPLPTSIQPGKPLPTVESAQPGDLSAKEYQSISESGVLAESLSRSRYRWINDGLFEKFWTKPHKRKGVVNEDPKNPPKDSMTKVGPVTITIEPHIVEATMFVVKEAKQRPPPPRPPQQLSKPPPLSQTQAQPQPQSQPLARPVLQYGPPNGSMPPPPAPASATSTPTPTAATTPKPVAAPSPSQRPPPSSPSVSGPQPSPSPLTTINVATSPSPGLALSAQPPIPSPAPPPSLPSATPPPLTRQPSNPLPGQQQPQTPLARPPPPPPPTTTAQARPVNTGPVQSPAAVKPATPVTGRPPPAAKPVPNDPVIALLAQKASGDPELRDLMKRVAVGQAKQGELDRFQKIIDQLNAEYRRSGGQQGPSADRLLVDGRTVKYFADEVRTILDIVLASNPRQRSSELRPPPRSDPLVVLLVKTALEDQKTSDMIRRVAENRPGFTDATDLKEILDRLNRDAKPPPQAQPAPLTAKQPLNDTPNGTHMRASNPPTPQQANPQALRSKGPPPAPKPDISAVVFDFGNGDRYLFPKFSILEYLPTPSGQEVVASFLIVRKGSTSEYGGDPKLDYYQPVTIRISTHTGRYLENLIRVVAPQDEVRRYMDDVMDNMTRAEYVLLAMHLPRVSKDEKANGVLEEPKINGSTPRIEADSDQTVEVNSSVLWTKTANPTKQLEFLKPRDPEEENEAKYRRLIQSVTAKDSS
ncbi:hypothetical protein TARUN_3520 [Trichoderma arundinaceum]|uniref:SWR1-complex protein 3 domain-containing protein n=1 Tax=Trichoderma arundinaceum TaxID=490622 RepID=A0A395NRM7_TRIAR|nr:hypothetical protein TARUN_3520 [Trichoderma arundinaceum]